jgi:hypothetical protein
MGTKIGLDLYGKIKKHSEKWFKQEVSEEQGLNHWCGKGKWTRRADGKVDVKGDVDLSGLGLEELPVKFGKVSGSFYCTENQLTTLEGSPEIVDGNFYCAENKLTTLEGGP